MINGIDPLLIFNFYKKITPAQQAALKDVNIVSQIVSKLALPPIPIYLSENLTGIYVDSEDKNIDIETTIDTLASGGSPNLNQKGLNSTIKINLIANKDSIGITLLSAMADLILPLVTSKEYDVTYVNGAITVFGGLLHSFSMSQNSNTDLMNITIEIIKGKKGVEVGVPSPPDATTLNNAGPVPVGGTGGPGGAPVPPATGPGPGGGANIPIGAGRML